MKSLSTKVHAYFTNARFFILVIVLAVFCAFTGSYNQDAKAVSVAAEKMNVFYIGIDNPVTVAVEGVADEHVFVHSDEVEITKTGRGQYNVRAFKPGKATLSVSGKGFEPKELTFRVKRIPTPVATLNTTETIQTYVLGAEAFKQVKGLTIDLGGWLELNPDLEIAYFHIIRVAKGEDAVEIVNRQADFNDKAKQLVNQAIPGSTYYIDQIKAKAHHHRSEQEWLKLGGLVIRIE